MGAALEVAHDALGTVPQMVPIYAHRYLPGGRGTFGHPVLSIYQTDIVCYGADLVDYMCQDFGAGTGMRRLIRVGVRGRRWCSGRTSFGSGAQPVEAAARMMNAAAAIPGDHSDKLSGKGVRPSATPTTRAG
jgi:hypothetical protein